MPDIWQKTMAVQQRRASSDDVRLQAEEAATRMARSERDRWQRIASDRTEQVRRLYTQLLGGDQDPTACPGHPGQILLSLGWTYHPDDTVSDFDPDNIDAYATFWEDPEEKDSQRTWYCLPDALNIAFRRFLGWSRDGGPESAPTRKTRYERIMEDDGDPEG